MNLNENKAGIYIHIPFCRKACSYCNFHFSTNIALKEAFIAALKLEIVQRKAYLGGAAIQSIYFGGGTPSLLSAPELNAILNLVKTNFAVDNNAEITLEANPDDIKLEYLQAIKKIGINRLSIGVQSFYDRDLLWMNRTHTGLEAEKCLDEAIAAGFEKITVDLIYGIPALTHDDWRQNIDRIIHKGINHISCYALTVEPKTALQHLISTGKTEPINDQHTADQFEILQAQLAHANFEHYEISNFARSGQYALHNASYWRGNNYLGLGPSAHSFNGGTRSWNIGNNALYIKLVEAGESYTETEELDEYTQMNEVIMTSLRTMWGLDLERFEQRFGNENLAQLKIEMDDAIKKELLLNKSSIITISKKGKIFADGIISDLFFTK